MYSFYKDITKTSNLFENLSCSFVFIFINLFKDNNIYINSSSSCTLSVIGIGPKSAMKLHVRSSCDVGSLGLICWRWWLAILARYSGLGSGTSLCVVLSLSIVSTIFAADLVKFLRAVCFTWLKCIIRTMSNTSNYS